MIKLRHYIPFGRRKLRWWLMACGLFLIKIEPAQFMVGTLLITGGSALHLWAKGHLRQNTVLTLTGPYRWVRNPFYLANLFIDTGLCLIINRVEFTMLYLVLWAIVYIRTIRKEEKNLTEIFGKAYLSYKAKVPRLIPFKTPLPRKEAAGPGFSWLNHNIAEGAELPRVIRFLSYPFLLLLASEFYRLGIILLYMPTVFELAIFDSLLILLILQKVVHIILKEKSALTVGNIR